MSDFLLALDVGSNACKTIVFNLAGESVSRSSVPYETYFPKPGWAEIDPGALWEACVASIRTALSEVDAGAIRAIGVSAQLGLVAVARDGSPISSMLPWVDRRALTQAERLVETLGEERIYRVTGRRCDPEWPACKILWLKENDPEVYAQTYKFLTLKDFLVQKLTGEFVVDHVHAAYSMLFNVERRIWEEAFFEELDFDLEKVPRALAPAEVVGQLTKRRAAELRLATVPVVAGGPDGTVGALGAGLIQRGSAVNVAGTTDVLFACGPHPRFDPAMRTLVNCYVDEDKWTQGGPLSLTGGCLKWFCDNFAGQETEIAARQGLTPYQLLDGEASSLPPGSDSLLFIPSLVGERTPSWNPNARGVAFGINPSHGKAHFFRAILEGSAFVVKNAMNALLEQGVMVDKVILVGGGAKSELWGSIRADVLGLPISIPRVEEATLLGSFLIAGVGTGVYTDFAEAIRQTVRAGNEIEPDRKRHAVYQDLYGQFVKLQENLRQNFSGLARR